MRQLRRAFSNPVPKTVAATIQSSTSSQLNGIAAPFCERDAPKVPLIRPRFWCSNCCSGQTDWVVTAKNTGPGGRRSSVSGTR
jgi:hypothetical protein